MTDPTEKWKARARDIVCAEVMMRSNINGNEVAWLEDEIAAALAEAYEAGEKAAREKWIAADMRDRLQRGVP